MEYLLHGVRDKIYYYTTIRREDRGIKAQVRLADRDRQTETGRHRDWQTQRQADRDWQTQRLANTETGREGQRWGRGSDSR